MQTIIQIYPCLLKLSRRQESVTDGQTDRQTDGRYYYIPHRYRGGIITIITYAQDQIILKSLGARKPQNSKNWKGHLYIKEEILGFNNNYMIWKL